MPTWSVTRAPLTARGRVAWLVEGHNRCPVRHLEGHLPQAARRRNKGTRRENRDHVPQQPLARFVFRLRQHLHRRSDIHTVPRPHAAPGHHHNRDPRAQNQARCGPPAAPRGSDQMNMAQKETRCLALPRSKDHHDVHSAPLGDRGSTPVVEARRLSQRSFTTRG